MKSPDFPHAVSEAPLPREALAARGPLIVNLLVTHETRKLYRGGPLNVPRTEMLPPSNPEAHLMEVYRTTRIRRIKYLDIFPGPNEVICMPKPEKRFQSGGIEASIFENEIQQNGKATRIKKVA